VSHVTDDGRLAFIATCDLVALTRGRSVPARDLAARSRAGVGWVPADLALTTFGDIADPNRFGALGDIRLIPDGTRATLPAVGGRPRTDVVLASIVEPDGTPWACDPRTALADAVRALDATGLHLKVAFEQEFALLGPDGRVGPTPAGVPVPPPFSIDAFRAAEPFGTELVAALYAAGLDPENWLPEYGAGQFEITVGPADPVAAADRAILVRAIVRDLASAHGMRATFVPLLSPDAVGNGVHVHLSLWDADGSPVTLDEDGDLTTPAGRFAAGILAHAPALIGWSAPSVISSLRLAPHRWSSAAAFLGRQNREAMLRICPVVTIGSNGQASANLEFRAADATANPWLVAAALIRAGLDGLTRELPSPAVLDMELDALDAEGRKRFGVTEIPRTHEAAMAAIEADEIALGWFADDLVATHLGIRRTEAALLAALTPEERCRRYADVL
jgi:glutamine synthetase